MQRGTLNLLLAIAVLALGALAWFKPGADGEPEGELAFPGAAEAALIRTTNADAAASWTLERDAAGAWALTAPVRVPADAGLVDALRKDLAEARARARYDAAALDAAAVGLDAPTLALEVGGARYAFGGTEPINYRRYVQRGTTVLLVDDLLHYRVAQGWRNLAAKRLLPEGARIERLELPGKTIAVDAAGKHTLAPEDPQVSADALTALLEAWTTRSAESLELLGPAVAQATLRVTLAGAPQPIEFQVLPAVEGLRLARPDLGIEYRFGPEARAALLELARTPPALPGAAPATAAGPQG